MADPTPPELHEELARLRAEIHRLDERLGWLEGRPAGGATRLLAAPPAFAPPPHRATGAVVEGRPWWQHGPLRQLSREQLPTFLLAGLGGLALLVGLLFFVWYSVEQGWLSPALRVIAGATIGVALLVVSWWIAKRDQLAVAAGLGGAGLGAWFAAWMVARHVHGFVSSREALVALELGCAAGLIVAGTRRLRAMAWIAAVGALLTPIVTSDGRGGLHELMLYQSVVIVTLMALEITRRWPELIHIASLGTWALLLAWIAEHPGRVDASSVAAWGAAALVTFHGQALAAWRAGRLATGHALVRLALGGGLAWFLLAVASAAALPRAEALLAWGTLAMASFHAALLLVVRRGSTGLAEDRALAIPLAIWGWLQLFAFAPLLWEDEAASAPTMALWWSAMAVLAAAVDLQRSRAYAVLAGALPTFAVLAWSFTDAQPAAWRHALGFGVALLPIALALAPRNDERARAEGARGWLLLIAGLIWSTVAWIHTEPIDWGRPATAIALVPVVLTMVAATRRATPTRVGMGSILALGVLVSCFAAAAADELFVPELGVPVQASARALQIATLVGLLALCRLGEAGLARLRAESEPTWVVTARDAAGLLAAFTAALAAMIAVGWAVAQLARGGAVDPSSATSLALAGHSAVWAACALWLLLRGLRRDRDLWRIVALTWLALTGLKVVFVDLEHVDLAWRVLSFVSLGACLLAGAAAYRRFVRARPAAAATPAAPTTKVAPAAPATPSAAR